MKCKICGKPKNWDPDKPCRDCDLRLRKENSLKFAVCKVCGQSKQHLVRETCPTCIARLRYQANPEKQRERDRKRWSKRRDVENQRRKEYYQTHKEQHRRLMKAYYETHKEEIKECNRAYRLAHLQEYKEMNRLYVQTHREKYRAIGRLRVQRVKALPHTLTDEEWTQIKQRYDNRCFYCNKHVKNIGKDHKVPVVRGGGYTADNIVPACLSCNSRKGKLTADEFIEKLRKQKR